MPIAVGSSDMIISLGDTIIGKISLGDVLVYSAGSTVTYQVDSSTAYTEEVDNGASCLNPTSFTPAKSGWTFVGWRQDKTAASGVLSSLVMGDSPITLYAVFKRAVNVTYYNGSAMAQTATGYRYYNNGNVTEPAFTLTPATISGWTFAGWCTGSAVTADVAYSKIENTTFAASVTLYAKYYKLITLTLYNGSTTPVTRSGYRYFNSGNFDNPAFTVAQTALTGWTARGWATGTAGNAAVAYASINNTEFTESVTLYGLYQKTCTLTAKSYNSTQTVTGTAYYNSAGNTVGASVKAPTGAALSGWIWRGWSAGGTAAANAAVTYANGAAVGLGTGDLTIYGLYYQTITVTLYNGSTTASVTTGTRYYNAAGNTLNPTFKLTQAAISGWTARGWSTGTTGAAAILYSNGAEFTRDSNVTLYGMYYQTLTLSYNGNGAASGSVKAQTGTRYYNSNGTFNNPSFTLSANGFTKANNSFIKWAMGGTGGTQYAVGASVTLTASTVFYAVWKYLGYTWVSNYVSAGEQPLEIRGSNTLKTQPIYRFEPECDDIWDTDEVYDFSYYTNTVPTNGCKYINITIVGYGNMGAYNEQDIVYLADASGNKLVSTGWHVNNLAWNETRTVKINVSAYSQVSIRGYYKGYNEYGPAIHISTVTFSNE